MDAAREERATFSFGPFVLDPTRRMLFRDGEPLSVTPKAFDILAVLAGNGGMLVAKDEILRTVWPDTVVDEGSLTYQVSTLRKVLADGGAGGDRFIVNVPGRGYQLAVPVSRMTGEMLVEERTTTTVAVSEETDTVPRKIVMFAAITLLIGLVAGVAVWQTRRPQSGPPAAPAAIRSLAVLPFKPLVAKERDEALEMGMADTLIAKISRIRGVTVRPLSAVRRYGGLEQDAVEAGRQLGVDAVLDGSIQNVANTVRVTARLLRVADSSQLWTAQFDSPFAGIFSVQDEITAKLADELSFKLSEPERDQLRKRETQNPDAYREYLLGRYQIAAPRRDSVLMGIESFKKALALDPEYSLPYAGLADAYGILPISSDFRSGPPSQAAEAAGRKALALDPTLLEARLALAFEKFWYEWDWKGSEEEFRRAAAINPANADLHRRYAHLLSNTGRHTEALREATESLRLDPLSLQTNTLYAQFLLHASQPDKAIAQARRALEINPDFWIAHLVLGKTYVEKKMYDQALEEYGASWAHSSGSTEPLARKGHLLALRGHKPEARGILAELMAISKMRYVPPYNIAMVLTGLGDRDQALVWLRRACTERDVRLVFLQVEPLWNALRADPGFAEIEQCVNLPRIDPRTRPQS